MSRTISQSLALQTADIMMEVMAKHLIERLARLDPDSREAEGIYTLIARHGHRAYESAVAVLDIKDKVRDTSSNPRFYRQRNVLGLKHNSS